MNHLVTDVARAVAAERLRQADHIRAGRRLSRNARSNRMRSIAQRSTPLLLAAAVFLLAFSSTATAAKMITGKQIKDGSIRSVDLRDRTLTGGDVADGTLTADDFAELVVGPQGPAGERGPDGPDGLRGLPGNGGLIYKIAPVTIPKTSQQTWGVSCDYDTRAVGGGFSAGNPYWTTLRGSAPAVDGKSWVVTAANRSSDPITGYGWAVCAKTS